MTRAGDRLLRNTSGRAAFFCLHAVAEAGPAFLTVPPDAFERQLATLTRRGWVTGGLEALASVLAGRRPARPTAFLTFDDGYLDNYTAMFPILRAYGARAIVYLLPRAVDTGGELRWPEVEADVERFPDVMRSMTWEQAGEMAEGGVDFGSHTLTHPSLPTCDDGRLAAELGESREHVRERLGSCDSIAYPFGHWDRRVAAATARAGYRSAFTLPSGHQRTVGPLSIPRLAVDHRDDPRRFSVKLSPLGRRALLTPAHTVVRRARALRR